MPDIAQYISKKDPPFPSGCAKDHRIDAAAGAFTTEGPPGNATVRGIEGVRGSAARSGPGNATARDIEGTTGGVAEEYLMHGAIHHVILLMFIFKCGLTLGQSTLSSNHSSCNNYIHITGETNINDFALHQEVPGDLVCGIGDSRWIPVPEEHGFMILVPVRNFKATNKFVYRDFLQLINVKKYPYIQIFMNESEFTTLFNGYSVYSLKIGVVVSGVTRYYQVPCEVSSCMDSRISVSGSKTLKLTDFNLSPPEKTFGLIKVHDELMINFEFSLPVEPDINLTQL
ncbi:MAG: hypothetical protein WD577_07215 [Bacteroidales bacterium]